jgi:hypothetical protein
MSLTSINIEQLIHEHSERMAQKMAEIVEWANTEEDVRHECNRLIDQFVDDAGLEIRGRHEYGLAGGRVDSKYGGVIIEYKSSKSADRLTVDRTSHGSKAAIEQVFQRFRDFLTHENIEPERILGVATDARMIVFVHQQEGKVEAEQPESVTVYTVERLLRALVSVGAKGLSYTPENLSDYFSADSEAARKDVRSLYNAIMNANDPKTGTLFKQWKILFGEVCGYDVEGKRQKIGKLGEYYGIKNSHPTETLFAVHTYYAIFMKLLTAEIVMTMLPIRSSLIQRFVQSPTQDSLQMVAAELERGELWKQLGILNLFEGDLFTWYLDAWNDEAASALRGIATRLAKFDPTTLSVDPFESRDLLKQLYQRLFPKSLRHDLGEYYTPDWLAELVLDEVGYDGNPDKRVLDPACGSGTFLVMAINRAKAWFSQHRFDCGYGREEFTKKIQRNIIGFDLNPLAVMAARTNFLIATRDINIFGSPADLPVYLCDSIMTPAEYGDLFAGDLGTARKLKTAVGEFIIPAEVGRSSECMAEYADAIESCVRNHYGVEEFLSYCRKKGIPVTESQLHRALFEKLRKLESDKQNGIWARIIKNSFAPLFVGKVDFVVGNPPWINWESLPDGYRRDTAHVWKDYGLFSLSGSEARLGGGKKDISMLFVYIGADFYLSDGGHLGYVITQTLFKTKGAGDGFRRFAIPENGGKTVIRPLKVHDFSSMQLFEHATNRTAILICTKQTEDFHYPVPYVSWTGHSRIPPYLSLKDVRKLTSRRKMRAIPIDRKVRTSPWLTAPRKTLPALKKILGKSDYEARAGCCTWLNGVYWVQVLMELPREKALIENMHNIGSLKVSKKQHSVERDLIYPLLRGRDVSRWRSTPSLHILMAQDPRTRSGIPEQKMKVQLPKTYEYFKFFESQLRQRSGFRKYFSPSDPFYSIYNVGNYVLSRWKLVWREQAASFTCAVIDRKDGKAIIPDHKLMYVPFNTATEAHYVAAALSSAPVRLLVKSYASSVSTSTHVLEHVAVPAFDQENETHAVLSKLSQKCHSAAANDDKEALIKLEAEIDLAASSLWEITGRELQAIQEALSEMERHPLDEADEDKTDE